MMQDRTINNALLTLRKQIIRGDGEGLEHVEALLAMWGVRLPQVLADMQHRARRGQMRRMVTQALAERPMGLAD